MEAQVFIRIMRAVSPADFQHIFIAFRELVPGRFKRLACGTGRREEFHEISIGSGRLGRHGFLVNDVLEPVGRS